MGTPANPRVAGITWLNYRSRSQAKSRAPLTPAMTNSMLRSTSQPSADPPSLNTMPSLKAMLDSTAIPIALTASTLDSDPS